MSLQANKALARRYFEDAPYNPGACDEIFAPQLRFHAIHHVSVSPEKEKASYEWLHTVWSDWRVTVDEMIAEKIAEIWDIVDNLWLWQQLGVLPETAEFIAQAREAILAKTGEE